MRFLLVLASALALSGCVYVHDSDLQKTAEDAQSQFHALSTDGTTEKLISSSGEFDKAVSKALDSSSALDADVQLQGLPDSPWASLFADDAVKTAADKPGAEEAQP